MSIDTLLVHELQLGDQLGQCIEHNRRADFSLMLAMLTDDVREHSQFFMPKTVVDEKQESDEVLRKTFCLPEPAPLAANGNKLSRFDQAELIISKREQDIHLQNVLSPLPLAIRDDKNYIDEKILSNTSLNCQKKYQLKDDAKPKDTLLNNSLSFNAKAWLDSIQTSLLKTKQVQMQPA